MTLLAHGLSMAWGCLAMQRADYSLARIPEERWLGCPVLLKRWLSGKGWQERGAHGHAAETGVPCVRQGLGREVQLLLLETRGLTLVHLPG